MDKHSPPEFHSSFYGPRYWPTWLGLSFFHLLGYLPMGISLVFGRLLGDLFFYLAGSRRHIAQVNIAKCFPHLSADEQHKLVRKIMHSTGKSVVESSVALWGPERQLKQRYTTAGLAHIESAQAKGQGVLLVGLHALNLPPRLRLRDNGVLCAKREERHGTSCTDEGNAMSVGQE